MLTLILLSWCNIRQGLLIVPRTAGHVKAASDNALDPTPNEQLSPLETKPSMDGDRFRTGKLADFFGVESDDRVGEIRKMVKAENALPRRKTDSPGPSFSVRINFVNDTYTCLELPLTPTFTTASYVSSIICNKLMITENPDKYAIYEVTDGGSMLSRCYY
ncbi:hypothetical protein BKA69DRAFT_1099674 [Paraphysoderma sedebokerense]|nr:hypothetical protein BKA69DRAFT_1099674 [Paraphysoderma sedebokerense]